MKSLLSRRIGKFTIFHSDWVIILDFLPVKGRFCLPLDDFLAECEVVYEEKADFWIKSLCLFIDTFLSSKIDIYVYIYSYIISDRELIRKQKIQMHGDSLSVYI